MRGERNKDRNTRKFISIPDMQKWEQIDELMSMPRYEKSFNRVINAALDYGLPLLLKTEKGEVTYQNEEAYHNEKQVKIYYRVDELLTELVTLIEEVVLNETVNKSLICSLFNERVRKLENKFTSGRMLAEGLLRDTPEYLENYERYALQEIIQKRKSKINE